MTKENATEGIFLEIGNTRQQLNPLDGHIPMTLHVAFLMISPVAVLV
jgi:hypothetical protein